MRPASFQTEIFFFFVGHFCVSVLLSNPIFCAVRTGDKKSIPCFANCAVTFYQCKAQRNNRIFVWSCMSCSRFVMVLCLAKNYFANAKLKVALALSLCGQTLTAKGGEFSAMRWVVLFQFQKGSNLVFHSLISDAISSTKQAEERTSQNHPLSSVPNRRNIFPASLGFITDL